MAVEGVSSDGRSPATPWRPSVRPVELLIDGRWRGGRGDGTFDTVDPATEQVITTVARATADDVDEAVAAARAALDGEWGRMSPHERGQILWRVGDSLEAHAEELAALEAMDVGRLYRDVLSLDVPQAADVYRYYAGWASKLDGQAKDAPLRDLDHLVFTRREPVGVVVAICPVGHPLTVSTCKIAPALACGNVVIHKPASAAPLSAARVGQLIAEAGVPRGVFQLLAGPGDRVGQALVEHSGVDKLSLTGSTGTGRRMIRDAAGTVKQVTVELGGRSANIVFADADLDAAAELAYWGLFYAKGENCHAGSRMLVERAAYDDMVERVADRARRTVVGDPFDPAADLGPIAEPAELAHVLSCLETARSDGARVVVGGRRAKVGGGRGYFVEPTVLADVRPDMQITREETCGPVTMMTPFDDTDHAVRLANDSRYGLAAGVQTRDAARGLRVANLLQAGTVWINSYGQSDPSTPFGGSKQSGYGREPGVETLETLTRTKSVWLNLA